MLCSSTCSVRPNRFSGVQIKHSQPQRQAVCLGRRVGLSARCVAADAAQGVQTSTRPLAVKQKPTIPAGVDIDSRYQLQSDQIQSYRDTGFVKLRNVFDKPTLDHYAPSLSLSVKEADKTPLQQDPDYQQAFTQVMLQQKHNILLQLQASQMMATITNTIFQVFMCCTGVELGEKERQGP